MSTRTILRTLALAAIFTSLLGCSEQVAEQPAADELAECVLDEFQATAAHDDGEPSAEEAASLCGRCGDGHCVSQCGENALTCPADCSASPDKAAKCGRCGDGHCVAQCGETALNCPEDCLGQPS